MNIFPTILLISQWFSIIEVGPHNDSLADAINEADAGDEIHLPIGLWTGNFTISKPLTIRGEGEIKGTGEGTVLTLDAPNIQLIGITISHSGRDMRGPDSGIYLTPAATGSVIKNCTVKDSGFGIWLHETSGVHLLGNHIIGETTGPPSNRGNGIHLFDGTDLVIEDNLIEGGRDGIYVSVTENSLIKNNITRNLRFGVHYMYSDHNRIIGNESSGNVMGYAIMQSKHIVAVGNIARKNKRDGLLFRDAQFCDIRENVLDRNGEGMFFFSSTDNIIMDNKIIKNKVGVKIWAGSLRNRVEGNLFIGNERQVFFVASEDMFWGEDGPGNYWSDYLGWDQDADGIGDRPYRVSNFSNNLIYKYPVAVLLLRSPSLELLAHLERKLPIFRVPTIIDSQPLMKEK